MPNPIRCYKYQRFGHVTKKSEHNDVSARCSATGHKDDTCTMAFNFNCVNCGENHASFNKKCSFYRREYDIQLIRVSNNVCFLSLQNSFTNS